MEELLLPPKYLHLLTEVTNEPGPGVALEIVIKDYPGSRVKEHEKEIDGFERKWGMKDPYSWENDYREWEAAVTLVEDRSKRR